MTTNLTTTFEFEPRKHHQEEETQIKVLKCDLEEYEHELKNRHKSKLSGSSALGRSGIVEHNKKLIIV